MKICDCKAFGRMLKERRKKQGYTQEYVSELTGLSVSFLSNLENGKETAELGRAIHYARILGLDIELNER